MTLLLPLLWLFFFLFFAGTHILKTPTLLVLLYFELWFCDFTGNCACKRSQPHFVYLHCHFLYYIHFVLLRTLLSSDRNHTHARTSSNSCVAPVKATCTGSKAANSAGCARVWAQTTPPASHTHIDSRAGPGPTQLRCRAGDHHGDTKQSMDKGACSESGSLIRGLGVCTPKP